MNVWQGAQQLAHILRTLKWSSSPQNPIFGEVRVTQGPTDDASNGLRLPCAFVRVMESTSDGSSPTIKEQTFEVIVIVANAGDRMGEFAMLGGQRTSTGKSAGRGLLEIGEQVEAAIEEINSTTKLFRIRSISTSAAEAAMVDGVGYCVTRAYQYKARLTTARSYDPPNGGKRLGSSVAGGTVSLTLTYVERFDSHPAYTTPVLAQRGGLVLVRKAGGSAPTSTSDGTIVSTSFGTTLTDTPGTGTWSYAVFSRFDEFGDGTTSVVHSTGVTASGLIV